MGRAARGRRPRAARRRLTARASRRGSCSRGRPAPPASASSASAVVPRGTAASAASPAGRYDRRSALGGALRCR
ncbi:hypothetical protein F1641_16805 [Quadrisphaera sp. INWT6]|nr:hypothetical protein [Quadrisphaera sp. INWT6]